MLQKMKKALFNAELVVASGFIVVTTAIVIMSVILRYVFKVVLFWAEEVATACFVWSVFIGSAAGFRNKAHVGVDMIVDLFPPGARKVTTVVIDLVLLAINGYISYIAVIYISLSYKKPTPVLDISTAYISSSILISFALMTIYSVNFLVQDLRALKKGGPQ